MLSKKKILIISAIVVIVLAISGAAYTYISIKTANDKKAQEAAAAAKNTPAAKKATADTKKDEGVKASLSGDTDKAKQLLLEAQAEYKALNDTNNVVDTEAQLYFIEHPSTPPAASSETSN